MSAAATFVYVSDAEDATIDAYVRDAKTGALTSIGKVGGKADIANSPRHVRF
jgi:6-phosphogluconolactonase (cycloisomerase 2 family)